MTTKYLSQKFKESFNKDSLEQKENFFMKAYKNNRIGYNWPVLYSNLKEVLNEIYGDRWDLSIADSVSIRNDEIENFLFRITPSIVLKFSSVDITNSKGYNHTIKDLYVKFDLTRLLGNDSKGNPSVIISDIRGRRMSANSLEMICNYHHSHLSASKYTEKSAYEFSRFCLGSSELNKMSYEEDFFKSKKGMRMLLYTLNTYLEWESLEGVPYNRIGKITGVQSYEERSRNDREGYYFLNRAKKFYDKLKEFYSYEHNREEMFERGRWSSLKLWEEKGLLTIRDMNSFEEFLKYKGDDHNNYDSSILVTKDSKGRYCVYKKVSELPKAGFHWSPSLAKTHSPFYFRGELVKFKINELTEEEKNRVTNFNIDPKIKSYVKQRIEQEINESRYQESISKELDTLAHT